MFARHHPTTKVNGGPGLPVAFAAPGDEPPVIDAQTGDEGRLAFIGPMDATVFLWTSRVAIMSVFDALAPYHETAVGVHSRIPRRPASESATNRNMNIAVIYAQMSIRPSCQPSTC